MVDVLPSIDEHKEYNDPLDERLIVYTTHQKNKEVLNDISLIVMTITTFNTDNKNNRKIQWGSIVDVLVKHTKELHTIIDWLTKLAMINDAAALIMGVLHAQGMGGLMPDVKYAVNVFEHFSIKENALAHFLLYVYNWKGLIPTMALEQKQEVRLLLWRALRGGVKEAVFELAELCITNSLFYNEALGMYERALQEKSIFTPKIYYKLGFCYLNGYGCKVDFHKGVHNMLKSAKLKYPIACNLMGWMCEHGILLPKNMRYAIDFYNQELHHSSSNLVRLIEFHQTMKDEKRYLRYLKLYSQYNKKQLNPQKVELMREYVKRPFVYMEQIHKISIVPSGLTT